MATISHQPDPTLEAIDRALVERDQLQPKRSYLGASSIGHKCERKLWYDFRRCSKVIFDAAALKRFKDGFMGEALQAERLRMVEGIQLATLKHTGEQYGFALFNGHFKGHYDGIIMGLLQAPKTPHIWEHKQSGDPVFNKLVKLKEKNEKEALENWNGTYYAQALLYMYAEDLTRHYLTCSTPGGRKTVSVRTDANPEKAEEIIEKADRIIFKKTPPVKMSDDPTYYECKYCDHYDICHQDKVPVANCRNCIWSEPRKEGGWLCKKYDKEATELCESHLYIPEAMPYEKLGTDSETESIIYTTKLGKTFRNGPQDQDSYLSTELENLPENLIGDQNMAEYRNKFDTTIVEKDIPF
jgi:CRISPR/Cas system-associated exonuclease Cas4 (RecB family)